MIKIENIQLNNIAEFLTNAKLSGSASRYRTKLVKQLGHAMQDLADEERLLVTSNGGTVGEDGKIEITKDLDVEKLNRERQELNLDKSIFNESVDGQFSHLYSVLDNYEGNLSGSEATAYDTLLDSFEEGGYNESDSQPQP